MLVLSRKVGETVVVNKDIQVTVVKIRGGRVRLGIEAPLEIPIRRFELCQTELELGPVEQDEDDLSGCQMDEWLDLCVDHMGSQQS